MSPTNPFSRDAWGGGSSEVPPPVVRDKRRIDPETGALRPEVVDSVPVDLPPEPESPGKPGDEVSGPDPVDDLVAQLAERTADLQRLQAEYVNYRRRVERDKGAVRDAALINVLTELLPILDDVGRARAHEELKGGFKVVAEALEATVGKLGLVTYGEAGDAFDPHLHEALMHEFSGEVAEPTCVAVLQPGYRVGDRIVRPARVRVAEPDPAAGVTAPDDISSLTADGASDGAGPDGASEGS